MIDGQITNSEERVIEVAEDGSFGLGHMVDAHTVNHHRMGTYQLTNVVDGEEEEPSFSLGYRTNGLDDPPLEVMVNYQQEDVAPSKPLTSYEFRKEIRERSKSLAAPTIVVKSADIAAKFLSPTDKLNLKRAQERAAKAQRPSAASSIIDRSEEQLSENTVNQNSPIDGFNTAGDHSFKFSTLILLMVLIFAPLGLWYYTRASSKHY